MRITVAALVGATTATYCFLWLTHVHLGAADFSWAIWAAQDLLAHRNPYAAPMQLYPLTSALFGLPFVRMRPELAGALFFGISSALLAFGISRHGFDRLLIFFAYPFWAAVIEAQWSPIILAAAFLPWLLPVALAKPQLGLPILFTAPTRRGVAACFLLAALSFAVFPGWFSQWLTHLHGYSRFVPLLVFPGPLLALALFRSRLADARFLLFAAIMPQRWFYDAFILWFIPKTRREIVWTVFVSWIPGVWRWYHQPVSFTQVGRMCVLFFYLPMLVLVFLREKPDLRPTADLTCGSDMRSRNER